VKAVRTLAAATLVAAAVWTPPCASAVTPPPVDENLLPTPAPPGPPQPTTRFGDCVTADPTASDTGGQPGQAAGQDLGAVWALTRGAGQTVAVIDTGVARHRRLPHLRAGGDYVSSGDGTDDCDGHGTAVAAIIGAAPEPTGNGFTGIAPDVSIMAIRQSSNKFRADTDLAGSGYGDVATLAAAVRTAADLGATVINISSVACLPADAALDDRALGAALAYAVDVKNVVVVTAAGNTDGPGQCPAGNPDASSDWADVAVVASPAWYDDYVLTVASVGPGGLASPFTLAGPWVDVAAPAFHVYDPRRGENRMSQAPYIVSAVLPAEGGGMLALTQNGLERYDPVTQALETIHNPEAHLPSNRFNDAKTDPQGRVWSGSMSLDASMPSGSLYRFDRPGEARAVDGGFQVSNGLDWSPDGRTFYFTDTALGIVFAYDYEAAGGTLSNRRSFLTFDPAEGKPDGLCTDSEGNLWIAIWDGWRVACYGPDGRLKREIDMPVPRPTSCCFGGDDMKRLFITSASIRLPASVLDEAPLSGALFAIDVDVPGKPATEARA